MSARRTGSPSRTGVFQNSGTFLLILAIAAGFGIEIATNSVGNDNALLKLGALPDNGQLRGEVWRFATYSFLHFNWLHLVLNVGLLFWIGRIVEQQLGTGRGALIYFVSVICSAAVRSEEHTSELQSQSNLVCRLLLE